MLMVRRPAQVSSRPRMTFLCPGKIDLAEQLVDLGLDPVVPSSDRGEPICRNGASPPACQNRSAIEDIVVSVAVRDIVTALPEQDVIAVLGQDQVTAVTTHRDIRTVHAFDDQPGGGERTGQDRVADVSMQLGQMT